MPATAAVKTSPPSQSPLVKRQRPMPAPTAAINSTAFRVMSALDIAATIGEAVPGTAKSGARHQTTLGLDRIAERRRVEAGLDPLELFLGALPHRALEPLAGREQVPAP